MDAQPRGAPLSHAEVRAALASLRLLPLAEVGSDAWWAQRRVLERLNAACHSEAGAEAAAAVSETPSALDTLVQALLVAEGWRERVAPQLGACARASVPPVAEPRRAHSAVR